MTKVQPYWWIKAVVLVLALVGVLWMIQSLRQEPIGVDLPPVPAKVHFDKAPPTPPPPK